MNAKPRLLSLLALGMIVALGLILPARPASAHPLGNFSVNQLEQLELRPDRVDVAASLDLAELPTLQDKAKADRDGDGKVDPGYARSVCADLARDFDVTVAGDRLTWTVGQQQSRYVRGSAGLDTTRLSCRLSAAAKLGSDATVHVSNRFRADRVGWRELTATGHGVHLPGSPLPTRTVSAGLLSYPRDLLSSPLDVRSAQLKVAPGDGPSSVQTQAQVRAGRGSVAARWTARAEETLRELTASHRLTPLVGALAVLLALALGAGHAVLPGHGKTAIAIALAGRAGRIRDAALIAGTVTFTHTGGVLALGLLLTSATAVAGETVLGWLGVASGVLLTGVGAAMLVAGRRRHHDHQQHHHHHDHHDHHDHDDHGAHGRRPGRLTLIGIGLAGGLVPSPSALIILLGAVGLGRTVFGILLVVGYGVGMAATLTGAGVTLVVLRERWAGRAKRGGHRGQALLARLSASAPTATAVLVLLVGCGLGARALVGLGSS